MSTAIEGRVKYWTIILALAGLILSQMWNLRAYAQLPEEVHDVKVKLKEHDDWIRNHESYVTAMRLDIERRLISIEQKLIRIDEKLDGIRRASVAIDSNAGQLSKSP